MIDCIRSAAFAASKALGQQDLIVKRSHLSEVLAALLGYQTYAALTLDEANPALDYHLEDAEILVLNRPMGIVRALGLNPATRGHEETVATACIEALTAQIPHEKIFVGIDNFYDMHARQAIAEAIYDDDDVAGAMAESNASFPDDPELDIECPTTEDLWQAPREWTISAEGEFTGEYDPDGDRMYNGHVLKCGGMLRYWKAGRAGLVLMEGKGWAGTDDSWRDQDSDVESHYASSIGSPQR
jgi:hypothetical protein